MKRIDFNQRNSEKINRDKILDYEKKMATLNNEINLTQQLYKTFMEAKARKNPKWWDLIVIMYKGYFMRLFLNSAFDIVRNILY